MPAMPFCITYRHEGKSWGITIDAENWEDAGRRLRSIGMTGQVDGELVDSVDMGGEPPASAWAIRWFMLRAALSRLVPA